MIALHKHEDFILLYHDKEIGKSDRVIGSYNVITCDLEIYVKFGYTANELLSITKLLKENTKDVSRDSNISYTQILADTYIFHDEYSHLYAVFKDRYLEFFANGFSYTISDLEQIGEHLQEIEKKLGVRADRAYGMVILE